MWQKREYWEGLKEKWDIRSPGSGCADLKFVEKIDLSKKKNLSTNLFVENQNVSSICFVLTTFFGQKQLCSPNAFIE